MKFEIEIPEELIQRRLDKLANNESKYGVNFNLVNIIDHAVQEAVTAKIKEEISISLPEKVSSFIDVKISEYCEQKIPGWTKRRVKEMLEAVRLTQITND